jgi:hypothetical protein
MNTIGYETGTICNRNGCQGIIDEHVKEGCCSCHISPPCSFCVEPNSFCPECGWEEKEEDFIQNSNKKTEYVPYKVRTIDDLDKTKIDWISLIHTHFSMQKIGVYPLDVTMADVYKEVKGTFGGRFESFKDGRFNFIAYTD